MRHLPPAPADDLLPEEPSKTKRKAQSEAMQALGVRLVGLSADQLKKVPLEDDLRTAILDARRFTKHEAIRRQMQYIGRLMRDVDPAPIEAMLAVFDGTSREETARLHHLEQWRDRLLDDETMLTEIGDAYPAADMQRLRQLRRNALKERELGKPPKSYREIFQVLKSLEAAANTPEEPA